MAELEKSPFEDAVVVGMPGPVDEKPGKDFATYEVHEEETSSQSLGEVNGAETYIPDDSEEYIDPRLKDYPIPLVAKTVDLHNDPTYFSPSPFSL